MTRIEQIARKHENALWEVSADPARNQIIECIEAAIREALGKACFLLVSAANIRDHFEEQIGAEK